MVLLLFHSTLLPSLIPFTLDAEPGICSCFTRSIWDPSSIIDLAFTVLRSNKSSNLFFDTEDQEATREDKLGQTKEQLCKAEEERDRAFEELNQVRKMAEEANSRIDTALAAKNLQEPQAEEALNEVKKLIEESNSRIDVALATNNNNPAEPEIEVDSSFKDAVSNPTEFDLELNSSSTNAVREMAEEANSKADLAVEEKTEPDSSEQENDVNDNNDVDHGIREEFETRLVEKQSLLDEMKKEMDSVRASEVDAIGLLNDCKRRILELEAELEERKATETNLYDSLATQTNQLELNKILLEESKLEIASLREKLETLQQSALSSMKEETEESQIRPVEVEKILKEAEEEGEKLDPSKAKTLLEQMSFLRNELELAIEGEENDEKAKTLLEEMSFLKNELKLATEAEANSKRAMDDLALALKEVATEANQTKEKLVMSQVELQHSREEAEHLRVLLHKTEDTYKRLLEDSRKEAERNNNTAERLRLEAEESLLAWNTETTEFVNCIRRAEEERAAAQEESKRLMGLLKEAENKTVMSKEENQKLRDILKQALNEANIAKEAAGIAQSENSQLKDIIAVRDEALKMVTHENEMLRIHEAAAFENIKELKKLLAEAPIRELKNIEEEKSSTKEASKEDNKEAGKKTAKAHNKEGEKEAKSLSKTISFNLKDIIYSHKHHKEVMEEIRELTDDDDLKGSIFDALGMDSGSQGLDGDIVSSDEIDESQLDEAENNSRKRKALLRRFGDLIRRKGIVHISGSGSKTSKDINTVWIPPEANMFKVNVDGSCWENDMSISCGGIIRDAEKRWVMGFAKNLGKGNVLLAEMWGIRMGLQIARNNGLSNITIETDSLAAIKLIKGNTSESHPLYAITEDIKRMLFSNGSMNLVHIPRNANKVADTMAKQGHLLPFGDFLYEEPPVFSS
ncbi:WEB family protein [Senna tora]|uniref:WEB family protein n=1 Tax=Senna tora TaxID=362788 RepID=A0A834WY81_9FABA|nr:WEB family protein [Senna tora]